MNVVDLSVLSEVWNWVVHLPLLLVGFWMSVLGDFSGGIGDRVRSNLDHSGAKSVLSLGDVSVGVNNVIIKGWVVIVESVLGDVVPFSLGISGSHYKLMVVHLLTNSDRVHGALHVWVLAEVWNWIIDLSWL